MNHHTIQHFNWFSHFCRVTVVTNAQSDIQTDDTSLSVAEGSHILAKAAKWPNNAAG